MGAFCPCAWLKQQLLWQTYLLLEARVTTRSVFEIRRLINRVVIAPLHHVIGKIKAPVVEGEKSEMG